MKMDLSSINWDSRLSPHDIFRGQIPEPGLAGWDLATDVYQLDNKMIVEMQVPGIGANDFQISFDEGVLTVTGSRKDCGESDSRNYYSREIHRGNFVRRVGLPEKEYDFAAMTVDYARGTLQAAIPFAK